MTKDEKSTFPGSMRDHQDAVKAEAEKVSAKIDEAFRKLAKKMRQRADKAKSKMDEARKPEKRGWRWRSWPPPSSDWWRPPSPSPPSRGCSGRRPKMPAIHPAVAEKAATFIAATGFFVLAICAYHLLRGRNAEVFSRGLRIALVFAAAFRTPRCSRRDGN